MYVIFDGHMRLMLSHIEEKKHPNLVSLLDMCLPVKRLPLPKQFIHLDRDMLILYRQLDICGFLCGQRGVVSQ
jgi:hypothetical protein